MTNTVKNAWLYTRIDTPEDEHGMLKCQEKDLIRYAEQMGFAIAGTSSDLGSGMDFDRPGLVRLIDAAKTGHFEILLVKSFSRLGRDMVQTMEFIRQLNELGVTVFTPIEGEIKLDSYGLHMRME